MMRRKKLTRTENPHRRTFGKGGAGSVEASLPCRCVFLEVTPQRGTDVEPNSGTVWEMCWGWGCGGACVAKMLLSSILSGLSGAKIRSSGMMKKPNNL